MERSNTHYRAYVVTFALFLLTSCSSVAQKGSGKPYSEDLSGLRPKIQMPAEVKKKDTVKEVAVQQEIIPQKTVNAKVDAILDSIDRFNVTRKFIDGFTIQIYSGQRREDANNVMKKMQEEQPSLTARMKYEQPKFRVTVGKYFTRLEAQSDLLLLKKSFSTASLVPEKIQLK